jgi:hypothetical protein
MYVLIMNNFDVRPNPPSASLTRNKRQRRECPHKLFLLAAVVVLYSRSPTRPLMAIP